MKGTEEDRQQPGGKLQSVLTIVIATYTLVRVCCLPIDVFSLTLNIDPGLPTFQILVFLVHSSKLLLLVDLYVLRCFKAIWSQQTHNSVLITCAAFITPATVWMYVWILSYQDGLYLLLCHPLSLDLSLSLLALVSGLLYNKRISAAPPQNIAESKFIALQELEPSKEILH